MKIANLVAVSSSFSQLSNRSTPALISIMTTTTATNVARRGSMKREASQTSKPHTKAPHNKKPPKAAKVEPSITTTTDTASTAATSTAIDQGDNPWYHFFTKGDAEYEAYMANEWSFEKRGDVVLFEKISLEGAQSGLSWRTILHKREAYRRAFFNFDPVKVATMTEQDVERILTQQPKNESSPRDVVVRHKGKIQSVIHNAKLIVQMQAAAAAEEEGVFDHFLWSFVNDKPRLNRVEPGDSPSSSAESEAMSKALKKRGFKFVGPTTCYALMQAAGMVIDHPFDSPEWHLAYKRLQERPNGYQDHTTNTACR